MKSGPIFDNGYRDFGFEGPLRGSVNIGRDMDHHIVGGNYPGGGRGHFSWDSYSDGTIGGLHHSDHLPGGGRDITTIQRDRG